LKPNKNHIYLYNLGFKQVRKFRIKNIIEEHIIGICHKFLRQEKKYKLEEQSEFNIKEFIRNRFQEQEINSTKLEKFAGKFRRYLLTRSSELKRNLLFLKCKDPDEFYLVHLKEDVLAVDEFFSEIVNVGINKEAILRVFLFFEGEGKYWFKFWEKYPSGLLNRLFNYSEKTFDYYSPLIIINCYSEEVSYKISITPSNFKSLYNKKRINFLKKNLIEIKNKKYEYSSLRFKKKSYDLDDWESFVEDILAEEIPIKKEIEKKIIDYKKKKYEAGIIEKDKNILSWLSNLPDYEIEENSNYVLFKVNSHDIRYVKERIIFLNPLFIEKEENYSLSNEFIMSISFEIINGTTDLDYYFCNLAYTDKPFYIGRYLFYNYTGLSEEENEFLIELQNQFKEVYEKDIKTLIVISQLCILQNSEYYQIKYFSETILNHIVKQKDIIKNPVSFKGIEYISSKELKDNYSIENISKIILKNISRKFNKGDYTLLLLGHNHTQEDLIKTNEFSKINRNHLIENLKRELMDKQYFESFLFYIDYFCFEISSNLGYSIFLLYNNYFSEIHKKYVNMIDQIDFKYKEANQNLKNVLNKRITNITLIDPTNFNNFLKIIKQIYYFITLDNKDKGFLQESAENWWLLNKDDLKIKMEVDWFQDEIFKVLEKEYGENLIKEKEDSRGKIDFSVFNIPIELKVFHDQKEKEDKYYDMSGIDILEKEYLNQIAQESNSIRLGILVCYDFRKENIKKEFLVQALIDRIKILDYNNQIICMASLGYRETPSKI